MTNSLILFASSVLSLRAKKKWSTTWFIVAIFFCFKLSMSKYYSTAWMNTLNIQFVSFNCSYVKYRCILFNWRVVEVINQMIIIIIITNAKKNCCDRMKNYWNEKSFEVTRKKAIHLKKKWNLVCLYVPHSMCVWIDAAKESWWTRKFR